MNAADLDDVRRQRPCRFSNEMGVGENQRRFDQVHGVERSQVGPPVLPLNVPRQYRTLHRQQHVAQTFGERFWVSAVEHYVANGRRIRYVPGQRTFQIRDNRKWNDVYRGHAEHGSRVRYALGHHRFDHYQVEIPRL